MFVLEEYIKKCWNLFSHVCQKLHDSLLQFNYRYSSEQTTFLNLQANYQNGKWNAQMLCWYSGIASTVFGVDFASLSLQHRQIYVTYL